MVEKFIFWIRSIFEETPLPDEIKNVVFKVNYAGKYKFIELLGYEENSNLNINCYRPLEAQFFNCKELAIMEENAFIYNLKYLIEECFSDEFISFILKGKNVFLYFKNNFNFLFKA